MMVGRVHLLEHPRQLYREHRLDTLSIGFCADTKRADARYGLGELDEKRGRLCSSIGLIIRAISFFSKISL